MYFLHPEFLSLEPHGLRAHHPGSVVAASAILEPSASVAQMLRCVLSCGSSGFLREGGAPSGENEGATFVHVLVSRDKGLLYV